LAISGTYTFNPDVGEIVEEAYERAGLEMRSGYDLRTARRSLNLLTIEWQNRGLNLWTIDEQTVTHESDGDALSTNFLNKGNASYRLSTSTSGLLDIILRTDDGDANKQSDYHMSRISQPTYSSLPNKLSQGRPLQYYLQRKEILDTGSGTDQYSDITLWPIPDANSKYKLIYWRVKRIADAGDDASNTMQVPDRFIPALVCGLAYHIACKRPEATQKIPMLKQQYEEEFRLAAEEDRVKTSARFVPRILGY
jgi:hypothetical protein